MLTIDPLKLSPFFNDTCSACAATQLQTSATANAEQTSFDTGYTSFLELETRPDRSGPRRIPVGAVDKIAGARNRALHFGS